MISMHLAALLLSVSGGGETVLLDFHADWCGPCRAMEPAVTQLIGAGYPVRKVNIDQDRALAAQYHVSSIPCYVLLVGGQEVDRLVGASSAGELQSLFAKARLAQSPASSAKSPGADLAPPRSNGSGATCAVAPGASPSAAPAAPAITPEPLLPAAVRLTIEDQTGSSYGSGTIIDAQGGQALILTCGHIFRESQGKGKIMVDVFGPQPAQKVAGHLISFDLKRDVGLVSIHISTPVTVARVAPRGHRLAVGDRVVSIGCDNGGAPSIRESKVTSLNKFLGPANVQVAGQPTQGRSGGGLFDGQGLVVGVCNAADPADNEGLFAAVTVVQEELDRARLTALYQPASAGSTAGINAANPSTAALAAGGGNPAAQPDVNRNWPANAPAAAALQNLSPGDRLALAEVSGRNSGAEVICIVRSLTDPQAKSQVIVLDRASQALLERLAAEQTAQGARHLTSLDVAR